MLRWRLAFLVSLGIALSYLDRQTLPVAVKAIEADVPMSQQAYALLQSAFLLAYGAMYLGGGRVVDALGTRRGFMLIMIFWSLACASHGLAISFGMLAASRLLLGLGEGGGFPAATRAVAEWFPATERSTAMGIINAGTAVGALVAPPLVALILGIASWRWVFFATGAAGLIWAWGWQRSRFPATNLPGPGGTEESDRADLSRQWSRWSLLGHSETWGMILAKFLSDAAWYFYLFWLPKYLFEARHFDLKALGRIAWIPYAASGIGCLVGGSFSSLLLRRGNSLNAARKTALGLSAAVMPIVILVPHLSTAGAIAAFSLAFFGQQSWSTLVMTLPTDLFPRPLVGTVAGLVGCGGALGGVVLGQLAGWLLDHGHSYAPVLAVAGTLHVAAFLVILVLIPALQPLRPTLFSVS